MSQFFSNYLRQALLNLVFRGSDPSLPETVHVALMKTAPNAAGAGGAEVAYTSYARAGVAVNTSNWAAAAVEGGRVEISNENDIEFPTAGSDGDDPVVGVALFDAGEAGNLLAYADLPGAVIIQDGNDIKIPAGDAVYYLVATEAE